MSNSNQNIIWKGIYDSYEKAQESSSRINVENIFDARSWYEHQLDMRNLVLSDAMPKVSSPLLPYACGLQKEELTIVDLGGGIGLDYFRAKNATKLKIKEYIVVETKEFAKRAKDMNRSDSELKITDNLPKNNFDIFYTMNSLHYLKNPIQTISDAIRLGKPKSIVLGGILTCDCETFYTIHERNGNASTVCIVNEALLEKSLKNKGYSLKYKIKSMSIYNGRLQQPPTSNLPSAYQKVSKKDFIFEFEN
jgi:putative methyltransferase (TIGR04325 family)